LDGKAKNRIFGRIFGSLLNGKKVQLGNYPIVVVGNSESFQVFSLLFWVPFHPLL
jgi:hypothetical protein